ncbi:MAG: tetratricopeptide repeat protein [Herpetosiphonaceae bacterium]|nr:tetratricopeptide repeat protein [Herpetosiphonaceae bacterium]
MQTHASFGTLLRECRLAAGLTQEGLAEHAGVSARTIRLLEQGGSTPQRATAQRLASALGLATEETVRFLAAVTPAPRHRTSSQLHVPDLPGWPVSPMPLVGREGEIAAVLALLEQEQCRMLTLTGPGGVGKTRVALAVARQFQEQRGHELVFVALAPLDSPDRVLPTIARAIGVLEDPSRPILVSLSTALRDRPCLLVLDNFEHVAAAGPEVAGLRAACPNLRLLVTSRVVLRVQVEQVYPVPPLAVAPPRHLPPLEVLQHVPAVQLFIERAQASKPDFALTAANAATVAHICTQLDGLPLAIELAARRVAILPVQALLRRLQDDQVGVSLQILTGGARDLPERQQTVRDTIAWSYTFLPAGEQALFRRLGVFRGGWSLQAAEALCADLLPLDALDGLISLAEQSLLVVHDVGGEPRFSILETIREYAVEHLAANGELQLTREQHANFFLQLALTAAPHLQGPQQRFWLDQLEVDHDNLRVALQWSLEHGATELGLRLAAALGEFWWPRGYVSEGRRWLTQLLALSRKAPPGTLAAPQAKALYRAGELAYAQGDQLQATTLLEESLGLYRTLEDQQGVARVLRGLSNVLAARGESVQAAHLRVESLQLFRTIGDTWGLAWMLCHTAMVEPDDSRKVVLLEESLVLARAGGYQRIVVTLLSALGSHGLVHGDYVGAARYFEEGLVLCRALNDTWVGPWMLAGLGDVAHDQGDISGAIVYYEESLALHRTAENQLGIAVLLKHLGHVARSQGDSRRAIRLYQEGLAIQAQLGDRPEIAMRVERLAAVFAELGQRERAARLFGATAALGHTLATPVMGPERVKHNAAIALVRTALQDAPFAQDWHTGLSYSWEQLLADALGEDS